MSKTKLSTIAHRIILSRETVSNYFLQIDRFTVCTAINEPLYYQPEYYEYSKIYL